MVQVNMTDLPPECHIEHSVTIYKEKKLRAKNKAFVGKLCSVLEMDVAISSGLEVEEIIQSHYATKILTDKLVLDGSARPRTAGFAQEGKLVKSSCWRSVRFFFPCLCLQAYMIWRAVKPSVAWVHSGDTRGREKGRGQASWVAGCIRGPGIG